MSDHATGAVQTKRYDLSGANSVVVQRGCAVHTSSESSFSSSVGTEKANAVGAIGRLGLLEEDWDGYGATPITVEAQQNAITAIESFPEDLPMPEIDPNPNGTISFDWASPLGSAYLEMGNTRFSFYVKWHHGKPILANGMANTPDGLGKIILDCLYSRPAHSVMVVSGERFRYSARRCW